MKTLIIIFISLIALNLFSMNENKVNLSGHKISGMKAPLSFGFTQASSLENFSCQQADTTERIAITKIPILLPMRTTITATGSTCGMLWTNVVYNLMFKVQKGFFTSSPLKVHSVTLTPGSYLGSVNVSPGLTYTVSSSQIFTVAFASSLPAGTTVSLTVYYSEGNNTFMRRVDLQYALPVCNNCRCAGQIPGGITVNVNDGSQVTPTSVLFGNSVNIFSDASTNFRTNAIQCTPNCPSSIRWTIKTPAGFLITSGNNSGSPVITSSAFTINNPGTYVLEIEYFCGNVPCGKNKIKLEVRSACRCGTWSDLGLFWLRPGTPPVRTDISRCSGSLELEKNINYVIRTGYTCPMPPNFCKVTYNWKITNPSSGAVMYSGTLAGTAGNTPLQIGTLNFTTPGTYVLEIKVKCGDTECPPCITKLVVTERCHCREGINVNASYIVNGQRQTVSVPCKTPAATIGPVPSNSAITLNYNSVCLPSVCPATYSWTVKRISTGLPVVTSPLSPGTSTNFTFTPAANTNDSYEVTITPFCGITSENCKPCKFIINTTNSPCPFISVNEGDNKICTNQGTNLTLTGWTGNGTNVTWYISNTNTQPANDPNNIIRVNGINLTGTTVNTGALLNNSTTCEMTTYYYQAKTSSPECISNPVLIKVYPPLPDITISGNTELCNGQFLNLTSSIGAANNCECGIKWYDSEGNFIAAGSNLNGLRLYSDCEDGLKKTYTFKVVYCEDECNEKSKTVNVNVYSFPEVTSIAAERDTICPLDATVLHATGACGDKIQWQMFNFSTNSWVDIGGATSVDFNTNKLEVSTLYRVVISNGPCTYTAISNTQWVIVQPEMSAQITYDPANRPCAPLICPDITLIGAVNLMGYNLDFNTYFEWYNGGTVVPNTRNNPVLTTSTPGNYYIRVTNNVANNTDVSQRCGIFESNQIAVSPLTVSISGPNCVCIPGSFTYTANSNCSSVTYKWYLNGNLLSSITTATANVNIANDGDVLKVVITSTNGGCTAESSVTINGCSGCQ